MTEEEVEPTIEEMASKRKKEFKMPKMNVWMISSIVLIIILIGVLIFFVTRTTTSYNVLSKEEAAKRAVIWMESYFEAAGADISVTLVNASEMNDVYQFTVKMSSDQEEQYATHYVSKDGKLFFPQYILTSEVVQPPEQPEQPQPEGTIGNFLVSDEPVCEEDGKPIIYFFGSQGCGYCKWEHPIVENVTASFEGYISFHNNMDNDKDRDIFSRYSTGGIPTIVLGCKYYRQGAGTRLGEEQEKKVLTAIICKLTNNQPTDVCAEVEDLIEQV